MSVTGAIGALIVCGTFAYMHWFRIRPLVEPRPVEITRVQEPPLVRAAKRGDVAEIRELISKGANVNAADSYGFTVLMFAVADAEGAVPYRLAAGANVNAKDNVEGATALIIASHPEKIQVVKELVNHGANVNAMSKYGQAPLMTAAASCSVPLVRYLLQKGANAAEKNARGGTALIPAVASRCADVAKVLLDAGADVNVRDAKGQTLLEFATRNHDARMVRVLRQAGAR